MRRCFHGPVTVVGLLVRGDLAVRVSGAVPDCAVPAWQVCGLGGPELVAPGVFSHDGAACAADARHQPLTGAWCACRVKHIEHKVLYAEQGCM